MRARTLPHAATRKFRLTLFTLAAAGWQAGPALGADAASTLPAVEVVSTTPLPGIGLPREQVPANVQALGAATVGERLRQVVAKQPFAAEGKLIPVTVRVGAATTNGDRPLTPSQFLD